MKVKRPQQTQGHAWLSFSEVNGTLEHPIAHCHPLNVPLPPASGSLEKHWEGFQAGLELFTVIKVTDSNPLPQGCDVSTGFASDLAGSLSGRQVLRKPRRCSWPCQRQVRKSKEQDIQGT